MAAPRRHLSPDARRTELLALGAEVFGLRPYDEVRIDEIAERAGVSRALMYHYFPDKRAFFPAVARAEGERLFEATSTPPLPGQTLFGQVRNGVLAYLRYDEEHPHRAWAASTGRTDPLLRGISDVDNDRQADRILGRMTAVVGVPVDEKVERDLRAAVYGWLASTFEMCRQRLMDPSLDVDLIADLCAHTLMDGVGRVPGIPAALADAVAAPQR
ncbi:TetR/AcrR family transcriptional regulator [Mycolicibacterium psychrotolerans]|uniref:TetR family transcriptional regulator n=1 Tax=Mycolicibacterium psychrotolerans TaxID=216929 RepID=A0A7I7MH02_9MYCO|nr:TetR/AcrR family transcriptional regulator [Mycolicibacterium psychrotolerans]BBX71624.1 TetR family transcriptional regulator [Mycolicibacterium psychrotolerans]